MLDQEINSASQSSNLYDMRITKLKRFMFENQITQSDLLEVLNDLVPVPITQNCLSRLMNGRTRNVRTGTYTNIKKGLSALLDREVLLDEIIDEDGIDDAIN